MRIDQWLQWKRTKIFCVALATLFAAERAWGADPSALYQLKMSAEQQRQLDVLHAAGVRSMYQDMYDREPTAQELKEALEFLRHNPQLSYLVERLSSSPEYRWRLRQLNPERIKKRKEEAVRIANAASKFVGDFLRTLIEQRRTALDVSAPVTVRERLQLQSAPEKLRV